MFIKHVIIKIACTSYINKICDKYLNGWIWNFSITEVRPTPLPADPTWLKKFNAATGDPDPKSQAKLAKSMDLFYRSGVGELIWAMTTCKPDIAFASVKLSQANSCLHEHHYHGLKHSLKYLFSTRDDGIYFWRTAPCLEFKEGPLPRINSNKQDLLLENRPEYDATVVHAYADSDWATCVKKHWSFGGTCIRLAGGTIPYKCKFQPTVAGLSTEAEFMAAYDTGKMILFVQSILWDLDIPQEVATVLCVCVCVCSRPPVEGGYPLTRYQSQGEFTPPQRLQRHTPVNYMRIMMCARQWVMLRSPRHVQNILT
jgi:hypothetical protein